MKIDKRASREDRVRLQGTVSDDVQTYHWAIPYWPCQELDRLVVQVDPTRPNDKEGTATDPRAPGRHWRCFRATWNSRRDEMTDADSVLRFEFWLSSLSLTCGDFLAGSSLQEDGQGERDAIGASE